MQAYTLIVDDDRLQRRFLVSICQKHLSLKILEAENGKECLSMLERHGTKIGVVILDWNMPDSSGLEILKIIKDAWPQIPVIIYSGSRNIEDKSRAIAAGASCFLTKPVMIEDLKKVLQAQASNIF